MKYSEHITLNPGTIFFKKVLVLDVLNNLVGDAVLRLISRDFGILPKYDAGLDEEYSYIYADLNLSFKCRFRLAEVLEVVGYRPRNHTTYGTSHHMPTNAILLSSFDKKFVYEVGKTVTPGGFDESPVACSNGIHGFLRYKDAEDYIL